MADNSLQGLHVLALESRRAVEIAKLIRNYGGEPTVVPAMREVPLESNVEALRFADDLLRGAFDMVICTTGVGVRRLMEIVTSRHDRPAILEAMARTKLVARGPKSSSALRELGLPIAVTAAEPSTWREIIAALDTAYGASLKDMRTAIQEYGTSNPDLLSALSDRQVRWTRVPVYQWSLPDDLQPLQEAIRAIAAGNIDVIVFLTGVQAIHLFEVAEQMQMTDALREGLARVLMLSIGPSTSEQLVAMNLKPDFEPSHPKMGILMHEAAQRAVELLAHKRTQPV